MPIVSKKRLNVYKTTHLNLKDMTHYYHLIVAGQHIDASTQFYSVGVGTSRQADRDFLFLIAWAQTHNYYFEKKSAKSIEFFNKCMRSVEPNSQDQNHCSVHGQLVRARDLVRAIKASEQMPIDLNQRKNADMLASALNLNYRVFKNLAKRN